MRALHRTFDSAAPQRAQLQDLWAQLQALRDRVEQAWWAQQAEHEVQCRGDWEEWCAKATQRGGKAAHDFTKLLAPWGATLFAVLGSYFGAVPARAGGV